MLTRQRGPTVQTYTKDQLETVRAIKLGSSTLHKKTFQDHAVGLYLYNTSAGELFKCTQAHPDEFAAVHGIVPMMKAEVTKETDISTAIDLCGQGYNGRAAFLTSGPLRMSKRGSFEYLFKVPAIAVVKIDVTKFTEKCIGALITMVQTAEDEELPEDELSKLEIWANRIASYSSPGGEKEKETPRAKRAASSSLEPKEPTKRQRLESKLATLDEECQQFAANKFDFATTLNEAESTIMKAHGEFLKVKKEKEDLEAQMALLQGRLKEVSKVFEKKSSERKTAKAQYDKVLSKLETFVWLLQDSDEKDDEAEDEEEEEDSNDGSGEEL